MSTVSPAPPDGVDTILILDFGSQYAQLIARRIREAGVFSILVAPDRIDWSVAALIAVGALVGGFVGARVGRRLSPVVLRTVIVVVGVLAIAKMVL